MAPFYLHYFLQGTGGVDFNTGTSERTLQPEMEAMTIIPKAAMPMSKGLGKETEEEGLLDL